LQRIFGRREQEFPLFNLYTLESIKETLTTVVEDCLKEDELSSCFLVDINHSGSKLEVFIDTDEGVSFSLCQKLSRKIEAVLDETVMLGEKYTLEVSSPGISRPLKFFRQYPRNIGREIDVTLKDASRIKGTLADARDNTLTIESPGEKKKETIKTEITFDAVDSSKILISFGKKKMKK